MQVGAQQGTPVAVQLTRTEQKGRTEKDGAQQEHMVLVRMNAGQKEEQKNY